MNCWPKIRLIPGKLYKLKIKCYKNPFEDDFSFVPTEQYIICYGLYIGKKHISSKYHIFLVGKNKISNITDWDILEEL